MFSGGESYVFVSFSLTRLWNFVQLFVVHGNSKFFNDNIVYYVYLSQFEILKAMRDKANKL